ncbi:hypothetical protein B0T24DRAFT_681618 [Lasiosphaeria ovina]|uniref:Uncharacterized protein n=1 Tax=Lasiosphaeria ovina TaxID=92902 RepID=A0AAE0K4S7_9PEZI|nr:hypothetical protein B0T24DRAFT_681618 [Lasiosphaeria ovina]
MATHSEFGETTPGSEVAKFFPDQIRGRIALVTGISPRSITQKTALAFASQTPDLLILASGT